MKTTHKNILALALLSGLTLSPAVGAVATSIPVGTQALLNGWDFDNILTSTLPSSPVRGRYSDVFGNNSSPTALSEPGGIYFNGSFGSDSWGSVAKNNTGDINRDIWTRSGSGSTFDLGGQTGGEGAANFNAAGVGTTFSKFSLNLHTLDAANMFEGVQLSLWGRDTANTAGGAAINWSYSIDGGTSLISTGLTSSFVGNAFSESIVNFSSITALNGKSDIYLVGQVVESETSAVLNLDNIGAYGIAAIPEPSTYAAILGALTMGVVVARRRKAIVAV